MKEIIYINSITDLHQFLDYSKPLHPMVSIIDYSTIDGSKIAMDKRYVMNLYSVALKGKCTGKMKYGRNHYDFEEGTLMFTAPEQVIAVEEESGETSNEGFGLYFHPDFIRRSHLASKMKDYSFFSYSVNEALHLSDQEKEIIKDCFEKIKREYQQAIDKHSQSLIISNIELLLNYCTRYYDRQFFTRENHNKDLVTKFEALMRSYFDADKTDKIGLPTVKECAAQMNFSPNYLSDLLKKETGKNTQEHIHYYLIEKAKTKLLNTNLSISQLAYDLGFEYPQYFSKIFKSKTGMSPNAFRKGAENAKGLN